MHYYTEDKPVILRGHFLRQPCFKNQKTFYMTGPPENQVNLFKSLLGKHTWPP